MPPFLGAAEVEGNDLEREGTRKAHAGQKENVGHCGRVGLDHHLFASRLLHYFLLYKRSSKSSPKAGQKLQAGTSGAVKSGLSSTVPAKRGAEVKKGGGGGKDRLSSTVAAGSLSPSGSRGSGARDAKKGSAKGSSSLSSQARSKENRETGERREERRREDVRRGRERTERGGGRDSRRGREEAGKKERDPREREEREGEKEDRGRRREKERGREKEGRGKEGEKNARISSSSTGGKPRISPEMDRKPPAGMG